jgi:hypothetical protein
MTYIFICIQKYDNEVFYYTVCGVDVVVPLFFVLDFVLTWMVINWWHERMTSKSKTYEFDAIWINVYFMIEC